jgi:Tfp pilus assembly protein FimT
MPRPGTTLLELTVVLAILGVTTAMVVAPAARTLDRLAARGAAADVVWTLTAARHAAVLRGVAVEVTLDPGTAMAWVRDAAGGPIATRDLGGVHGVRLAASNRTITFDARGLGWGLANSTIVLRRGAAAETVVVSRLGRVMRR